MLVRHTTIYALGRVIPGLVTFVAIIAFSRLMSPAEYGVYALALAAIRVVSSIGYQWLCLGLLRFWTSSQDRNELVHVVGSLAALVSCAMIAIGFTFGAASATYRTVIWLCTVGVCFWGWLELLLEKARAELRPVRYGMLNLIKTVVWLIAGVLLTRAGFGTVGAIAGLLAGLVAALLIGGGFSGISRRYWRVDKKTTSALASYGWPLTGTFVLNYVVSLSDRFFLAWIEGDRAAGLYSVAYDLSYQTLSMLMMAVNLAAFPLALQALDTNGPQHAREQLRRNVVLLMGVATPAAAGLMLLAPGIASVFIGSEFKSASVILLPWIASAALIGGFKSHYLDHGFHLAKSTIDQLITAATIAGLNVIFNLALIPAFGMMGAAYSTLISYACGVFVTIHRTRAVFRTPIPSLSILRIVVATAIMTSIVYLLDETRGLARHDLLLDIGVGIATYGTAVVALNVGSIRDKLVSRARTYFGLYAPHGDV